MRPSRTRVLPGSRAHATQPRPGRVFSRPPVVVTNHGPVTKLHIGCGNRRLAGWVNADAVPGVGEVVVDLQGDLGQARYSEIYGSHVLEHCWPQDTPQILQKLFTALVPGGTLRLSVPDLRLVVRNCLDSQAYGDENSALSVLFGGTFSRTTAAPDLHRQAFWKERLEGLLVAAGFVNVREWGAGQYPAIDALKDYATVPHDSEGRSLISLNLEADRPGTLAVASEPTRLAAVAPGALLDVSVLLGTVDRPEMLKNCIEAVRASVSPSSYEIVVAYGRENDVSLPWLREQKDVTLVLGGMDGAIEAFNRAYAVSRGQLICQLNDDVVVDGDSIQRAISHLNTDAGSAGAVFKFDRMDGKGYRHEHIGSGLHPNQMVVRRETCEAVIERIGAFWGDADHRTDKTYGGDSAFGVVCLHLGLRLDSIEGVTCKDLLAQDALRTQNKAVSDSHSARWKALYVPMLERPAAPPAADEWPNCYLPRPGMAPRRSPIAAGRPLRVFCMPVVVEGWPLTALRQAFEKTGPYAEALLDRQPNKSAIEQARQFKPDLVWVQIQRDGWQDFAQALRDAVGPDCTMVQWSGDVRTDGDQPVEQWLLPLAQAFDILLADNCTYPRKLAREGIRAGYQCHGFESELVWEPGAVETGKAVFIGSNYRQLDGGAREKLFTTVDRELPGTLELYGGGWRGSRPVGIADAGGIMRRAAVTISKSLFCNLERYTSNRLKYALAVGAVTAVERFPDMEGLGLLPGQNCLVWSTQEELIALLRDWTQPERAVERQAIRECARALAVDRFTWDRSVEELLAIVRDYRARKGLS